MTVLVNCLKIKSNHVTLESKGCFWFSSITWKINWLKEHSFFFKSIKIMLNLLEEKIDQTFSKDHYQGAI